VLLAARILWFRYARQKESYLDTQITTPPDYSLMITGMPRDVTEKEVRKTFEDYLKKNGTSSDKRRVYRVNFAYYIGDFIEIAREKNEHLKILFKEKR
jgi:Cytosolic domain of 10TM putative phosphate transporter